MRRNPPQEDEFLNKERRPAEPDIFERKIRMNVLDNSQLSKAPCGDAAWAPGCNSWGEVTDQAAFDQAATMAACQQSGGWFTWACFDYALKYGSSY